MTETTIDAALTRRAVLRAGLASGALAGAVGLAGAGDRLVFGPLDDAEPAGATVPAGDVLVVVSLRGGFDGLSAIVPVTDPDYLRARPNLGVPTSAVLPGDDRFGLHPALAPLRPFWQAGTFGAVHAVAVGHPNRSHFSAMSELERSSPSSSVRTGWLDRLVGVTGSNGSVFQASQVGATGLMGALAGPRPELTLSSIDDFRPHSAWNDAELARWSRALGRMYGAAPATVATPAKAALAAMQTTTRLRKAGYTPANGATYPDSDLGRSLRDVARLIKAGVGLRVALLDVGDWDFHVNLGTVDSGRFTDKLADLAAALAAFATDLGDGLDGVTVVTVSEFGRRVAENGSGGTDHGHANAVLLLGGGVVGGRVHGRWPGLADANLVDGDLDGTSEYRQLLAEIVHRRCGVSSTRVGSVFPGLTLAPAGVVRAR